jgi:hypothetical protein
MWRVRTDKKRPRMSWILGRGRTQVVLVCVLVELVCVLVELVCVLGAPDVLPPAP